MYELSNYRLKNEWNLEKGYIWGISLEDFKSFSFNYIKIRWIWDITIIYKNEFIWSQKILVIINSFEVLILRL